MNYARRIIHSVFAIAVSAGIIFVVIYFLKKNVWYFNLLALAICTAVGYFFGTFDTNASKPLKVAADESEIIDDGLDE